MITRQQYLEALDLVERYHRQNPIAPKLTRVDQWEKINHCGLRLYNCLIQMMQGSKHIPYHQEYIELVDVKGLARNPNVGQKSISEFIELRGY